jgi:hypothetical protein
MRSNRYALATTCCLVLLTSSLRSQCGGEGLTVTFSPPAASPGEVITVTLTNKSPACTYVLPTDCVFQSVHAWACTFPAVHLPACSGAPVTLPPGASISQVWDQKDDSGQVVGPANYVFSIQAMGASAVTLCPEIEIGECTLHYGPKDPGTGGYAPQMSIAYGSSWLGNSNFHLTIIGGVGAAPALLVASTAPAALDAPFGTLLVDLASPHGVLPLSLGGPQGAPGSGSLLLYAPVPNIPALEGTVLWMQTLVLDAGSSGGVAASTGLRVRVCKL